MDQKELQQKIVEYYEKLPVEAQKFFAEMGWMRKLEDISLKYSLDNNQKASLGIETTLVLLGMTDADKYKNEITSQLKLSKDLVDKIVSDINNLILKDLENKLKESSEKDKNEKDQEIMGKSGIEIKTEEKKDEKPEEEKITIKEDSLLVKSGVDLIEEENPALKEREHLLPNEMTQKASLEGIENPEKVKPSIINQKLSGVVSQSVKVRDYTEDNNLNNNQGTKKDPYREPIE